MKRSEMVGKISDVLLQFMPTVDIKKRNLIADVMLFEAEREGMLPPHYATEELIERDADNGYGDWFKIQVPTKVTKRKWEPEDE